MPRAPGVNQPLVLPGAPVVYSQQDQNEVRRKLQALSVVQPDYSAVTSIPASVAAMGATAPTFTPFAASWVGAANAAAARALLGVDFARGNYSKTTGTLAALGTENGTITVPDILCALARITVSDKCWVRLYTDAASRTSDSGRSFGTLPTAGTGVLAEFDCHAGGSQTVNCSPVPWLSNDDTTPAPTLYYAIQNRTSGAAAITVTLDIAALN